MHLATMAYVHAACATCVAIFSTASKFQPVSNFTELQKVMLLLQLPVRMPLLFIASVVFVVLHFPCTLNPKLCVQELTRNL